MLGLAGLCSLAACSSLQEAPPPAPGPGECAASAVAEASVETSAEAPPSAPAALCPSASIAFAGEGETAGLKPLYTPAERGALPGVALVLIDMQVGMMPVSRAETVFAAMLRLVAAAESEGAPIAWGYMNEFGMGRGSPEFELAAPLEARAAHIRFIKTGGNSFNGSGIVPLFDRAGVGTVVIGGMSSDGCVKDTVNGALKLGYRVIVAEDGHTIGTSVAAGSGGDGLIDTMNGRFRRLEGVRVLPAADIAFAPPRAQ